MIKRLTFILLALTILVSTELFAAPTLTSFSAPVNTVITPEIEITLADLKNQGDESADTVSFSVRAVVSGSLRLGSDSTSATAFDATNFLIDANNMVFWTADSTDVGKSLGGFEVVANDNLGASSAVAVQVPISAIGNSVTSIGKYAFRDTQLTSVVIPSSVTSISNYAFYNTRLTKVVIPSSVISIGAGAFRDTQLTEVVIGNSVTSIGNYAFQDTKLTSVVIPSSVTTIGAGAFTNTQLTSVVIPDSVTSISNYAFYNTQLTEVVIGNSVTSIDAGAFYNTQLTSVVIPDSVISIGDSAFYNTRLTSVVIPDSVTSISNYAFYNTQLTEVVIGNSVTSIGAGAFQDTKLTSVVIPSSVTTIGKYAFPLVAQGQSVVTDEDQPISITLSASDADGDSLTYTVVSQPSNGVLTGTAPNLTYKSNAGFNGNDSFTFKANDGTTDTKEATIKITITPNQ